MKYEKWCKFCSDNETYHCNMCALLSYPNGTRPTNFEPIGEGGDLIIPLVAGTIFIAGMIGTKAGGMW